MEEILKLLKAEQLKPVIGKVLPLAHAQEAHELIGARAVEGKIVLLVNA